MLKTTEPVYIHTEEDPKGPGWANSSHFSVCSGHSCMFCRVTLCKPLLVGPPNSQVKAFVPYFSSLAHPPSWGNKEKIPNKWKPRSVFAFRSRIADPLSHPAPKTKAHITSDLVSNVQIFTIRWSGDNITDRHDDKHTQSPPWFCACWKDLKGFFLSYSSTFSCTNPH